MPDLAVVLRWIHVLSASAWFGEVVVINVVLIPALSGRQGAARREMLATIFPRVFRLASVLAATTAVTGGALLYLHTGGDWRMLTSGRWGMSILVGGTMGLVLVLFHFFMEDRLARRAGIGRADTPDAVLADVHVKLQIVPRVGLVVITTIIFLMMYAVRGA
jgi:uncharacterized membrane protein